MITLGQLHNYIDRAYLHGGRDVGCCKKIAANLLASDREVYTYGDLLQSANIDSAGYYKIEDIQYAVNVLKADHVGLLHETYRYIDDDVIYDLSLEELQVAMEDGCLDLELRGYPDRDFKSKVYVMFSADRAAVSL